MFEIIPGGDVSVHVRDRTLKRGLALGLRPEGQQHHPEAFALLRGLAIDELDMVHRAASNSNAAGLPGLASDLYRAVTVMYGGVRDAFQRAITGEHDRHVLIERRMRAAGLELGTPTPVERCRQTWSGVMDAANQQKVLPEDPWPQGQTTGINAIQYAPRPDWAPSAQPTADTLQLYVAATPSAWAVAAVRGGNGREDREATRLWDAGAPVSIDPAAGAFVGASSQTQEAAARTAVIAGLRIASESTGTFTKVVLRARTKDAKVIAGMAHAQSDGDLRAAMRRAMQEALPTCPVSLSGWCEEREFWWGERALALAKQCANGRWGASPTGWQGPLLPALAGTGEVCPVCLDDLDDPLPAPANDHFRPRAPEWYQCPSAVKHAVCIPCELERQQRGNDERCVMCRAPRLPRA